jgi:D-alanine-D-alanine ligase
VPRAFGEVDVVFPLLHGAYGEDGTIQGLLELAGVHYVGSGVFASAAAMDKGHMKALFAAHGLPVGPYAVVRAGEWDADPSAVRTRVADLGFPVFVKPCRAGSSVGITKVRGLDELDAAMDEARRHDPRIIVEAAIEGREIECGVLERVGGGRPEASVCAEVRVSGDHEFYDFEAKYLADSGTELDVPADVPPAVQAQVQSLAVDAFEALGCEGLARVDFFLRPDGTLLVNEVNTMPGFTPPRCSRSCGRRAGSTTRRWSTGSCRSRCTAPPACVDRLLLLRRRATLHEQPANEQIWTTARWRIAHATGSRLLGWLVLLPRRHVEALHELEAD